MNGGEPLPPIPLTAFLIPAVIFVFLVAVGAWLAIRFEKWRESRNRD